jgi:hypothetical protein
MSNSKGAWAWVKGLFGAASGTSAEKIAVKIDGNDPTEAQIEAFEKAFVAEMQTTFDQSQLNQAIATATTATSNDLKKLIDAQAAQLTAQSKLIESLQAQMGAQSTAINEIATQFNTKKGAPILAGVKVEGDAANPAIDNRGNLDQENLLKEIKQGGQAKEFAKMLKSGEMTQEQYDKNLAILVKRAEASNQ